MNKFRLVVWSLNWVVALACGCIGIVWYLDWARLWWLDHAQDIHSTWGLALFLVALLTVVVNLLYVLLRHFTGRAMRTHIPVKGADANITVSLHALRNSLVRALMREPEVHSVDVELTHDRRKKCITHILARGTIWDGPDILQTTVKMQKVLRSRFHEIVEPEEEPTIEVKLDSFRFVGKQVGFRERVDRIKETFRGPQYPIGE
jgi:hypothetical protein